MKKFVKTHPLWFPSLSRLAGQGGGRGYLRLRKIRANGEQIAILTDVSRLRVYKLFASCMKISRLQQTKCWPLQNEKQNLDFQGLFCLK